MSYTAMDTRLDDDIISATICGQIRDNWIAGIPDIFTGIGQIAAGTAANTAGVVAPTSSNQYAIVDSTAATGMAFDPFGVRMKKDLSGTTVVEVKDIATDENDTSIGYGVGSSVYMIQQTGVYLVYISRAYGSGGYITHQRNVVGDTSETNYTLWPGDDGQYYRFTRILPMTEGDGLQFNNYGYVPNDENYAQLGFIRLGVTT